MSFFETLPVDLQNSLRAVGPTQKFETGAAIIRSGSVDNTLYALLAGSLKVEFSEQVIHLSVGNVVGEMAFLIIARKRQQFGPIPTVLFSCWSASPRFERSAPNLFCSMR